MPSFADRLACAVHAQRTPVLVGLDPRVELLPQGMMTDFEGNDYPEVAKAYASFCKGVIDVVAPLVPAVKPQMAFFEQLGPAGMTTLADVVTYARTKGLLVILDGKRNDIGSTASAYADAYLGDGPWGADALTVSPYLGDDSLEPFVETAVARDAGLFVLVKTSNPGGIMLQDKLADGQPVFQFVAQHLESLSADSITEFGYGAVGAVVGATYPEQLAALRDMMPHCWILVPGFGSQGGTPKDVQGAFDQRGLGAIINSSRAIIFAYTRDEYRDRFGGQWQRAIEAATLDMIAQLRSETLAGRLG